MRLQSALCEILGQATTIQILEDLTCFVILLVLTALAQQLKHPRLQRTLRPTSRMRFRFPRAMRLSFTRMQPDLRFTPARLAPTASSAGRSRRPTPNLHDRKDKVIGQHSAGPMEVERWQRSHRKSGSPRRFPGSRFNSMAAGECCEPLWKRFAQQRDSDSASPHARRQASG